MNRQQRIESILSQSLSLEFLSVENESSQHHVPEHSETHFKIIAVSNEFEGINLLARHRLINTLCREELDTGLHALSLHLFTPSEWETKQPELLASPKCRGGRKKGK